MATYNLSTRSMPTSFFIGDIFEFTFTTATRKEITLPPGQYKLEVWGAQGFVNETQANDMMDPTNPDRIYAYGANSIYDKYGGAGGYSYGTLTLTEPTKLYVYVGEHGYDPDSRYPFNSGINFTDYTGPLYPMYDSTVPPRIWLGGGGGGATDIRIGTDSLYSRVIVAGGGGGGYQTNNDRYYTAIPQAGGFGGGEYGTVGYDALGSKFLHNDIFTSTRMAAIDGGNLFAIPNLTSIDPYDYFFGSGGTQTSGGKGGKGGSGMGRSGTSGYFGVAGRGGTGQVNDLQQGSCGGGGWYGGGGGVANNVLYWYSSGGGSGFVLTSSTASSVPSGYLLGSNYYLTNAETKCVAQFQYLGSWETPGVGDGIVYNYRTVVDTSIARKGHGYAKITVLDVSPFMYIGVNGKAKQIKKAYIGVNGKAKQIKKAYVGVNGKAKRIL